MDIFLQRVVDTTFCFGNNRELRYKNEEFCPAEALQVVCDVDDGPKTDWLVVCVTASDPLVQVGTKFK